jgi:LysR family transcriptional regulator, hca operon transcriptional activator
LEAAVELLHLRYFVAVAEELSFRKAAGRLSVSEPAISQQVADLEDELGVKLFNRDSRRVELTEVGRVFFARSPAHACQRQKSNGPGSRSRYR